ncbi:protein FAM170A-like isoform X1 [Vulpes lagopus]|uniref:protein FAM170A-like isoform X1 n=1 Tax=Vulpes lagopus TaxID=494514 RepID=UPI001BC9D8C3|nr:protein FAM170A-like isoform X1 [Vulpes lagopus]XP_041619631.1 protein FAM170A-like isoform X1 [Vulpes lagopus]XP_041619633.1 protein FAM170A-like isoform X1 [Vulpes lagopus]XP_041619634.1 protein FAM170A-like isoform X1 [Vulpes lagopus]XP_041619635.1 protein FAM170A-like isoform X1 [Vulpes lagopus]XP_041619636.1 protein FAM170A-like isoform X1 [Vulpes lagopus]XP_041619637.1 protein FAM170A-like isoform X1 [Vulpes lagopus]XP_041619638.1 protein FAM170A-like isoform X1 [Vulpes lagopus]XP_
MATASKGGVSHFRLKSGGSRWVAAYNWCTFQPTSRGVSKSQADAPQVESTEEAKGWDAGVEEVSSASEYFSCVSSPLKLTHSGLRRVHRDSPQPRSPLAQVQERGETAPPSHHVSSSPSSYKTCVSSLYINKKERGMKIYYMRVQMKKGVAVSWETEETSESVEKQPRMEEVTLPEDVRVGTPPSDVSTRNLLSDSEPSGEEQEHEERAESDSPPGSPAVEEGPRAKTPDWLVTMETGFRCMACCRVFSTLESLQEHVQHGVREGFSCHVFHLTMARLGGSRRAGSAQEEEGERSEAPAARPEGKASEEEPATREDLGST